MVLEEDLDDELIREVLNQVGLDFVSLEVNEDTSEKKEITVKGMT